MADKKPDTKPPSINSGRSLPKDQALAGAAITPADIARARAKWKARVKDFEERIRRAKDEG